MISEQDAKEVVAFAQQIIRVDSPTGQEGGVANLVEQKMNALGFEDVSVDSVGNVVGIRRGQRPGPVVLFDSHMDVVPVPHPENWDSHPYAAEIRDGKIYGRGAVDMKGPLAAVVVGLGKLPAADFAGTLVVSATVGEEVFEGGALAKVLERIHPDFTVICEPNDACLGIGQKGRAGITVEALGKPAHSSVPHLGVNAVYKGIQIVERLRSLDLPTHPLLGPGVMEAVDAISYPFPSLATVPVSFKVRYDRRLIAGETRESVLDSIRTALKDIEGWQVGYPVMHIETFTGQVLEGEDFHPGWLLDPASAWVEKARIGLSEAGIQPRVSYAKFCTNGSLTAGELNIPTMIFGPSNGLLAHCDNECIAIDDLILGANGYQGLARHLSLVKN